MCVCVCVGCCCAVTVSKAGVLGMLWMWSSAGVKCCKIGVVDCEKGINWKGEGLGRI